jgi:hypothetical protein
VLLRLLRRRWHVSRALRRSLLHGLGRRRRRRLRSLLQLLLLVLVLLHGGKRQLLRVLMNQELLRNGGLELLDVQLRRNGGRGRTMRRRRLQLHRLMRRRLLLLRLWRRRLRSLRSRLCPIACHAAAAATAVVVLLLRCLYDGRHSDGRQFGCLALLERAQQRHRGGRGGEGEGTRTAVGCARSCWMSE